MALPDNATLADVISAQNEFIAEQTQKIATLETNNAEALENLAALGQRVYGYNHEPYVVKSLEETYNDIINNSYCKTIDTVIDPEKLITQEVLIMLNFQTDL